MVVGSHAMSNRTLDSSRKGYDISPTGLVPRYPEGYACSPLTSLYASWIDVDGSHRGEQHSGVDGGRIDDWVLAPAAGTVRAVWEADWGWGREGALLIVHAREDLGLRKGPHFYYSEFDHVRYDEVSKFRPGQRISRGERLAQVTRPGGNKNYLPEVHWEVWEVSDDSKLRWTKRDGRRETWTNPSARLIDPLFLLAAENGIDEDGGVLLTPYQPERDFSTFRGFTYILPCTAKARDAASRRQD